MTMTMLQEKAARAAAGPPILDMRALEKHFGRAQALAPVTLNIGAGEFVSLIGPSGCGKSTLLKLVARLLEPSGGGITWWDGDFAQVGQPGRRLAFGWRQATFAPDQTTMVEVRFEAVGEETRVTVEHTGWDRVPPVHVARHALPDPVFSRHLADWWRALLASLGERL